MDKIRRQIIISNQLVSECVLPPKLFTALYLIEQGAPLRIKRQNRLDPTELADDEVEFLGDISSYEKPEWDAIIYLWKQEIDG